MEQELNDLIEALKESEEKYKALYENAPLSYQSLNADGTFRDVNPTWLKTLGYDRDEVIGKSFGNFLHPDWKQHFEINFPAFKARGYVSDVHFKIKHKDGHYIDISFEGCIGYYPDGSFKQTYCVFKDITEQNRTQEKLKEALDLLKNAGRTAKFGGWNVILSENRSYWSDEVAAIHEMPAGYAPLLQDGINFYAPEWREKITQVFTNCAQNGISYDEEMEILTSTGKRVWVRTNGEAVKDDKGNIFKVQGGFQDITERKKIEEALRQSEEKYRLFTETASDFILVHDMNGQILYANPAIVEKIGYSYQELINMSILNILPKDQIEQVMENKKLRNKKELTRKLYQLEFITKEGTTIPLEIASSPFIKDGVATAIFVIARDITDRKKKEEAMKQKTKELQDYYDLMIDRELKMVELKEEVNQLLKQLGKEEKYEI